MKTLILTDIHSNLYALQAVLQDSGACEVGAFDQIVFLGDVANFGPHPSECIRLLRTLNPISVVGNHDVYIAQNWVRKDCNAFDRWSRGQIGDEQKAWLRSLPEQTIMDIAGRKIMLIHGAYDAPYDLLPGIPDHMIEEAFANQVKDGINEVWFGHYHYQIDRTINGVTYHCIRPVGHHRDGDTRAGYSIYANGVMKHYRVAYDIELTVNDTIERMTFLEEPLKSQWIALLRNAFQEDLLQKDIACMNKFKS